MSDFGLQLVEAARSLKGIPWRHQGRDVLGLDCIGLCIRAAFLVGVTLPDIKGYPRRQTTNLLQQKLSQHLSMVPIAGWKSGDIGLFRETGHPVHVGVLARGEDGANTVIHAHARRRKVVEEDLNSYGWPQTVYRIEGTI